MGDLISRSALKEEIESLHITITGLRAGKGILQDFANQYKESILRIIDEQPAAYVDKVVEENKQMKAVIYKASEELQKIIDYPHGIISCVQFFPKLREIQDELVGILEDGQVE